MDIIVSRFYVYPKDEPNSYCVGFSCNEQYIDVLVPIEKGKEPDYYVTMAKILLKENLQQMAVPKPSVIGMKIDLS